MSTVLKRSRPLICTLALSAAGLASAQTSCTAGQSDLKFSSGEQARSAVVYRPAGHDNGALPIVLTLHGSASDAREQLTRSDLQRLADSQGFMIVSAQGIIPTGQGFSWNVPGVTAPQPKPIDDEKYLSDLIDRVVAERCGDPKRVYGTGYSGGGRMLSQFVCDVPGKLAAIATIAGLRAGTPHKNTAGGAEPDPASCNPKNPVPIIAFQGNSDPVNPYAGGGAPYWQYSPAQATSRWVELNGCNKQPVITRVAPHVWQFAYGGCNGGSSIQSYIVNGGGHTWPGNPAAFPPQLGNTTTEISASDLIWSFFKNYAVAQP